MSIQTFPVNNKDRLINARKNRQIQLERWEYYEKEILKSSLNGQRQHHKTPSRNIKFSEEVILLEAVARNDIKEVTELLRLGANPNSVTIDGLTGLHQCCIDDYLEMGNLLLRFNANVNSADSEMWTPLHAAATCGNDEMCKLLIRFDADLLAINADGNMPYDICEGSETLTIIETEMAKKDITQEQIDQVRLKPEQDMMNAVKDLILVHENLDFLDCQGASLLHIACSMGYNDVVQTLLEVGASHSLPDKEGWLPIHIAACWNYVEIVEILVAFGANIDDKNMSGDTVFDICEPQFKDKLYEIKNHVDAIRSNFNRNRLPQNRSFRKSRGSSIRRSSVRQKNMMSRKEAKEEFLTMNLPVTTLSDVKHGEVLETVNDEDNSDIDSCNGVDPPKQINHTSKTEVTLPAKQVTSANKPENSSLHTQIIKTGTPSNAPAGKPKKINRAPTSPPSSESTSSIPVTQKSKSYDSPDCHTKPIVKTEDVQLDNTTVQSQTPANNGLDALNRPHHIYSSSNESWDDTKKTRRRGCCGIV